MNYLFLALSVCLGTTKNICSRLGKNEFSSTCNMFTLNFISSIISALMIAVIGKHITFKNDIFFYLYASAYALFTIFAQITYIKAVSIGSTTITSLIYSFGFLIPTVFGTLFYNEYVSIYVICGIILITLSLFLTVKTDGSLRGSLRWLSLSIISLGCSGAVGIVQKLFRSSIYKKQYDNLLFINFLLIAVPSVIHIIVISHNSKPVKSNINTKFIILSIIIGAASGGANKLNILLSGVLPSAIFFPCVNGGCVIITGAISAFLFKERLTLKQFLGILIGLVGIVIIGIFK